MKNQNELVTPTVLHFPPFLALTPKTRGQKLTHPSLKNQTYPAPQEL